MPADDLQEKNLVYTEPTTEPTTDLFVNGTLMRGLALHPNLAGAEFLGEARTVPRYRLHSIGDVHPGMYRLAPEEDGAHGVSVAGEVYRVPADVLRRVEAGEPPGLHRGPVELTDGRTLDGILYPRELAEGRHLDISAYGDWRAYTAARPRPAHAGTAGTWAWHHSGVVVPDLGAAVDFHRRVLGFDVVFEALGMTDLISGLLGIPGLGCDLVQCVSPVSGVRLELLSFRDVPAGTDPRLPVWPGVAHTAHLVDDLDAALDGLVSAGGELIGQVTEFAEGRAAYCWTPSRTVVELEEQPCH
ncbi:gamma-glutamylcyclotransferase [Streptomyces sp. NPDC058451]|uniref:allophanate hydrolase-related protein n=1 Tax=Streptomyces sp. NPDC058451 TaxID=3346506 RepID=UPI003667EF42